MKRFITSMAAIRAVALALLMILPQGSSQAFWHGVGTQPVVVPLRVAANLTRANYGTVTTVAGTEVREQRSPHYWGRVPYSECWLQFSNWYLAIGSGAEFATGNAMSVALALEYNGVTVVAPNATVASPATVADGGDFLAGPFFPAQFGVSQFAANQQFFARVRSVVTPGQLTLSAGQYLSVSPASRIWMSATDPSQLANTGPFVGAVNTQVGPTVTGVYCRAATGFKELAVMEFGDSIGEGNSDIKQVLIGQGYFDRGAAAVGGTNGQISPFAHQGRHGGTLSTFFSSGGIFSTRRLAMLPYVTHLVIEFGANDLFYLTTTNVYTQFQSQMLGLISIARNAGVQFVAVNKVIPRAQSSDTFLTYGANQLTQFPSEATITGAIAGTILTVTATSANNLFNNVVLTGIAPGTTIVSQISGTTRGVGTYNVSVSQTLASQTIFVTGGPGVNGYWDTAQITTINNWIDGLKTAGTIDAVYDPLSLWTNPTDVTQFIVDGVTPWYCCTTGGDGNGANVAGTQFITGTHPSPPLNTTGGTLFGSQLAAWPTFN